MSEQAMNDFFFSLVCVLMGLVILLNYRDFAAAATEFHREHPNAFGPTSMRINELALICVGVLAISLGCVVMPSLLLSVIGIPLGLVLFLLRKQIVGKLCESQTKTDFLKVPSNPRMVEICLICLSLTIGVILPVTLRFVGPKGHLENIAISNKFDKIRTYPWSLPRGETALLAEKIGLLKPGVPIAYVVKTVGLPDKVSGEHGLSSVAGSGPSLYYYFEKQAPGSKGTDKYIVLDINSKGRFEGIREFGVIQGITPIRLPKKIKTKDRISPETETKQGGDSNSD